MSSQRINRNRWDKNSANMKRSAETRRGSRKNQVRNQTRHGSTRNPNLKAGSNNDQRAKLQFRRKAEVLLQKTSNNPHGKTKVSKELKSLTDLYSELQKLSFDEELLVDFLDLVFQLGQNGLGHKIPTDVYKVLQKDLAKVNPAEEHKADAPSIMLEEQSS